MWNLLISLGSIVLFAAIELAVGVYRRPGVRTMRELGANLVSVGNAALIRGASFGAVLWALGSLWPRAAGALGGVSFWIAFPLYVLVDEYGFYWVHRKSHELPWLWRLHKPHHTAEHMNAAVAYRENWLWFLLVPTFWLAPVVVFLGQPAAYVAGVAFRTLTGLMVHSDLHWDMRLQRIRGLRPLMWVLERVVSLPDTHQAHHGVGRHGDAMKNYGASLICFDLLHRTLLIPHARQERFGLPAGAPVEPWAEQIFWPIVRSKPEALGPRARLGEARPELAAAGAVIRTADGRTVPVH